MALTPMIGLSILVLGLGLSVLWGLDHPGWNFLLLISLLATFLGLLLGRELGGLGLDLRLKGHNSIIFLIRNFALVIFN